MATKKVSRKKTTTKTTKKRAPIVRKLTKKQLTEMDRTTEKEPDRNIDMDANDICIDCAQAAESGMYGGLDLGVTLHGNLYTEDKSTSEKLRQISAIDLRGMNVQGKFAVLEMLDNEGYIATNIGSFISDLENLAVFLQADSLRLQHTNKLVIPGLWEDILDCSAIATVHVRRHTDVFFDTPCPAYPEETFLGDARYIRVS